jgi:hypothetical protein
MRDGGSNKKEDRENEGSLTLLEFHRDSRLIVFCVSMLDGVTFH